MGWLMLPWTRTLPKSGSDPLRIYSFARGWPPSRGHPGKKEPGTHIAVDAGQIPGGDLLSQDLSSQYHRRCSVSLPGSEWDRVVPPRSGHQRAALVVDSSIQGRDSGCLRHLGSSECLLCSVVVSGPIARSLTSTRRIHLSSTSIRPLNRTRSLENKRLRTESSRTDD